jgi:hypothetical protein
MKVDFGPLDRTSKREVCVSLTFRTVPRERPRNAESRRKAAFSFSSGGGTRTHNLPVNSRSLLPIELPRIDPGTTSEKVAVSGGPDDTSLYFGMAVGTQENALLGLGTNGVE